ncbi:MAG: HlyD family efflux transporter periplasmic adaptor subunit [Magnetospirillum sp.]|nr:HlyD family efflux transporter periplasmic adaptor subunit [Magnetospirillum sp.]
MALLRQDLSLHPSAPAEDGSPAWVLHDPAANRYFRLSWLQVELLTACGEGGEAAVIAERAARRLGCPVEAGQVTRLLDFLAVNDLIAAEGDAQRQRLLDRARAVRGWGVKRLAGSMVYFRLPLVRPDAALGRIAPRMEWWFGPAAGKAVIGLLAVGLFLVARQWDAFTGAFPRFFTVEGALAYALGLMAVKAVHEFGHAITAKHHGCRVPVAGVALMVFWPVLYTDTTDAWRLTSRRRRMEIGLAGVKAEMAVAALCLLAWSFLPDGPLRSLCQLLATTNLLLTLTVNLNPLMRFDGYYVLMDWSGIDNLQPRALGLWRWWLRRTFLGLPDRAPEAARPLLIAYGGAVQAYRLSLTLGISVLLYHYVFPLLGIAIGGLYLWTFLVAPLVAEAKALNKRRADIHPNRRAWLIAVGVAVALGGLVPWQTTVSAPAVLKPVRLLTVYTAVEGRVTAALPVQGTRVEAGAPLLVLDSPDLAFEREQVGRHVERLRWQVSVIGFRDDWLGQKSVLSSDLAASIERRRGLEDLAARQVTTAPFAGVVVDVAPGIAPGSWLGAGEAVLAVADPAVWEVVAYVREADVERLSPGVAGRFLPRRGGRWAFPVTVAAIEPAAAVELDAAALAVQYGGDLAVRLDDSGRLRPLEAIYRVRLTAPPPPGIDAGGIAGQVVLHGRGDSPLLAVLRRVLSVIEREARF